MSGAMNKEKYSREYFPRQLLTFADLETNFDRGVFDLDSGHRTDALFPGKITLREFFLMLENNPQGVLQIPFLKKDEENENKVFKILKKLPLIKRMKEKHKVKEYLVFAENTELEVKLFDYEKWLSGYLLQNDISHSFTMDTSLRELYEELKLVAEQEKLDYILLDFNTWANLRVRQTLQQLIPPLLVLARSRNPLE